MESYERSLLGAGLRVRSAVGARWRAPLSKRQPRSAGSAGPGGPQRGGQRTRCSPCIPTWPATEMTAQTTTARIALAKCATL